MSYARHQALAKATVTPWTKDLRHVRAVIPRLWARPPLGMGTKIKSVKPKDRIKWWNIVPGDQVRLRGDPEDIVHEVRKIDKLANRVYLRTPDVRICTFFDLTACIGLYVVQTREDAENKAPAPYRQVAYSKCQLLVGEHMFPPLPGETTSRTLRCALCRLLTMYILTSFLESLQLALQLQLPAGRLHSIGMSGTDTLSILPLVSRVSKRVRRSGHRSTGHSVRSVQTPSVSGDLKCHFSVELTGMT